MWLPGVGRWSSSPREDARVQFFCILRSLPYGAPDRQGPPMPHLRSWTCVS